MGRNGVPGLVGAARLLPDDIRAGPLVGIHHHKFGHEPVAVLRRSRAPADPLHQFGVAMTQAGGLSRAKRLPQGGVVVRQHRCRRGRPRLSAIGPRIRTTRRFLSASGAAGTLALTRIRARLPLDWRAVTQQSVPVKGEIRMGVFQRLAYFRIERFASDLDVRRGPEQIQQLRACLPGPRPVGVHHIRAVVPTFVVGVADKRQNLPLLRLRLWLRLWLWL